MSLQERTETLVGIGKGAICLDLRSQFHFIAALSTLFSRNYHLTKGNGAWNYSFLLQLGSVIMKLENEVFRQASEK